MSTAAFNTVQKIKMTTTQKRVHAALLKHSSSTGTKHHYQCRMRDAYNSLRISPYAFAGAISSLHRLGLYCHIFWTTNPERTGYKDHPKKTIKVDGLDYAMRSDVAIVIDPVFFEQEGSI